LQSIKTFDNTQAVLKSFTYGLNELGQRETITREDNTVLSFAYNQRREVESGEKITAGTGSFPAYDYGFDYDEIGNRKTATGVVTSNYVSNALNQYTSITPQGGAATAPTYDDNGSNLSDERLAYTWDERNRLKEAEEAATGKKVRYQYDTIGRRLQREELNAGGEVVKTTRYLYEQWNCVAEFDVATDNSVTRSKTYTWGLDLSQNKQGAGGVGGLCATVDEANSAKVYHFSYDGNGNVHALYEDDFTAAAEYEYSPFGQTIAKSGVYADENEYRFSTKPEDQLTKLNYYGFRWYDTESGRWLSRDPVEERGGINLYGMAGNDSVNQWDLLGMSWKATNCRNVNTGISFSAYAGLGASASGKIKGQMCDCCNSKTGETRPDDEWSLSVQAKGQVGLGGGARLVIGGYVLPSAVIRGPQVTLIDLSAGYRKKCGPNKGQLSIKKSYGFDLAISGGIGAGLGVSISGGIYYTFGIEILFKGRNYDVYYFANQRVSASVTFNLIGVNTTRNYVYSDKIPKIKHSSGSF